jgi:hypothetical protein
MTRVEYHREQAALCREMARQISNPQDVQRLMQLASGHDSKAEAVERRSALEAQLDPD